MRILIIRLGAIGDVIMALGLIPALRARYPEARIDWLTESTQADLLRHHPDLDTLHLWPRRQWRALRQRGHYGQFCSEAGQLIRTLRGIRYDLVLDLQGLLKSGVWAWLSGGKRRVGLGSREGSQWLMTETLNRHSDSRLIGKEYRKLAQFLGAGAEDFRPVIGLDADDIASANQWLQQLGRSCPGIMVAPFTTRPQKHWFADRWLAVADALCRQTGQPVLLLGGPGDAEQAAHWVDASGGSLTSLVGQTRLGEAAALIARADLLMGVDTGLTHLGMVLGTPTLALFGSTRPYLETENPNGKVLYHPLACSPCRRHPTCEGRFDCMARHEVDSVLAEASALPGSRSVTAVSSSPAITRYPS